MRISRGTRVAAARARRFGRGGVEAYRDRAGTPSRSDEGAGRVFEQSPITRCRCQKSAHDRRTSPPAISIDDLVEGCNPVVTETPCDEFHADRSGARKAGQRIDFNRAVAQLDSIHGRFHALTLVGQKAKWPPNLQRGRKGNYAISSRRVQWKHRISWYLSHLRKTVIMKIFREANCAPAEVVPSPCCAAGRAGGVETPARPVLRCQLASQADSSRRCQLASRSKCP